MEKVLATRTAPADALLASLNKTLPEGWLQWEPETLWSALRDQGTEVDDSNQEAIQAVRALLLSDSFYTDVQAFQATALGLSNHSPNFQQIVWMAPHEVYFAVFMAKKIRPKGPEFSDQVKRYIQACFVEAGMLAYPELLAFAEPADRKDERNRIRAAAKARKFDLDTMIGVQAAKLHDAGVYLLARTKHAKEALTAKSG